MYIPVLLFRTVGLSFNIFLKLYFMPSIFQWVDMVVLITNISQTVEILIENKLLRYLASYNSIVIRTNLYWL